MIELLFRIDANRKLKRRRDIAFVSAKKWPVGKRVPKGEAWDMVPDLAVEVVSESNSAREVIQKVVDYLSGGSRLVWVVYADVKQVHVYTDLTSARILTEPAELDVGDLVPGFRLSLTELFEACGFRGTGPGRRMTHWCAPHPHLRPAGACPDRIVPDPSNRIHDIASAM